MFKKILFSVTALATLGQSLFANTTEASCQVERQIYTLSSDFDKGSSINVGHEIPDQLQLDDKVETFDVMWVAASGLGTIVKINTKTGEVLGEYRSGPSGRSLNPSRTTVDNNGNVWAGNRNDTYGGKGSIVKIGLVENGQCIDRNGNGVIDTSSGLGDVKPWGSQDAPGGVVHAEDECILHYVRVDGTGVRHVSVDENNNVWAGGWSNKKFNLVDGENGNILGSVTPSCGGYGGLIDHNGVLWSASHTSTLRYDTKGTLNDLTDDSWSCLGVYHSYGLGIDSHGNIWNSKAWSHTASKLTPEGQVLGTYSTYGSTPTGLTVGLDDDAWITNRYSATIARLASDGTYKTRIYVGGNPTGAATDAEGKIWVSVHDLDKFVRIDPATNQIDKTVQLRRYARPYNYSDMTGSLLTGRPNFGTWNIVKDSGISGALWDRVSWSEEVPDDSNITVWASTSEDGVNFSAPILVEKNSDPYLSGRYINISVRFSRATSGESPILYDLSVGARAAECCTQKLNIDTNWQMLSSVCDVHDIGFIDTVIMKKVGESLQVVSNDPDTQSYYESLGYEVNTTLELHRGEGFWIRGKEDGLLHNLAGEELTNSIYLEKNTTRFIGFPEYHALNLDETFKEKPVKEIRYFESNSSSWKKWQPNHVETDLDQIVDGHGFYLCAADDFTISLPNLPPVAKAKNITVIVGNSVGIDGSQSFDKDGYIVSYEWLEGETILSREASFNKDDFEIGKHTLALTVMDNDGSTSTIEIAVHVVRENTLPTVDLGEDRNITEEESISFFPDATDSDGYLVSHKWYVNSNEVAISPYYTLNNLPLGEHNVTLEAIDNDLGTAKDSIKVFVRPAPDTLPPYITLIGNNPFILSIGEDFIDPGAMATDDRDGTLDVETIGIVDTTTVGDYFVVYSATDAAGNSAETNRTVIVQDPSANVLPVVELGSDKVLVEGETLQLQADASDSDGSIVGYQWISAGDIVVNGTDATITNLPIGKHTITLVITDDQGAKASDSIQVEVISKDEKDTTPPEISILGNNPHIMSIGENYTDAGATAWDNRDGSIGVGVGYSITTNIAGVYLVTYSAVDSSGNEATAQRSVLVQENNNSSTPDITPPVITLLGANPLIMILGEAFYDPGVVVVDDRDGQLGYSLSHNINSNSLGSYSVIYSAIDTAGNESSITRKIYVKDASGDKAPIANAGVDIVVAKDSNVTISAALSRDPDGEIISYEWREDNTILSTELSFQKSDFDFGSHELTLKVIDNDGLSSIDTVIIRVIDPSDTTPPIASITAPAEGSAVKLQSDIIGTASDANLDYYELLLSPVGKGEYTPFKRGTVSASNGILATFDATTIQNGIYDILLKVVDQNGEVSMASTQIIVEGKAKIGNFSFTVTDFDIQVGGLPLQVNRTYSTLQRTQKLDFTYAWSIDYQNVKVEENRHPGREWKVTPDTLVGSCFKFDKSHIVSISLPDGTTESFEFRFARECAHYFTGSFYDAPKLYALNGSTAKLETIDASDAIAMSSYGEMIDSQTLDTYNPSLYKLTLANGMVYEIKEGKGLKLVKDLRGDTLTYNNDGILSSRGESLTFERDSQNRITKITDLGGKFMIYHYNANDDLDYVIDQLGNKTTYTYQTGHLLEEYFDPSGTRITKNIYDESGRLIQTIDPDGNVVEFTHDIDGREEIIKDKLGRISLFVYDDEGNVLAQTNPLGETTTRTYDANGNELTVTDALGNTMTNTYDVNNNLLETVDALGHSEITTYNVNQSPTAISDKNGNTMNIVYNDYNNPRSMTTASGATNTFYYDQFGNKTQSINEYDQTTTYEYDSSWIPFLGATSSKGNLLKETQPNGITIEHTYDESSNLLTTTTTLADGTSTTTSNTYDAFNRLVTSTDALGQTSTNAYDARGNKVSMTDSQNRVTAYTYNNHNKTTLTTYSDGTTESKTYDAMDNLLVETNQEGETTSYEYDNADRLIKTIYADGTFMTSEFDTAGKTVSTTDQNGNTTTFEYDAVGNRLSTTDALNHKTTFTYDAQGNMLSMTDALSQTTSYEYNALNQRVKTTYPDGTSTQESKNISGLPVSKVDEAGQSTSYGYDTTRTIPLLNQVTLANSAVTRYGYDSEGKKTSQTDALDHTTVWSFKNTGELETETLPQGEQKTFTYDAYGKQTQVNDYANKAQKFIYDANDKLVRTEYADGSTVTYAYTPAGRLKTLTDAQGIIANTYDSMGRLKTQTNPNNETITYSYDGVGNIVEVQTPQSTISKTYDALNRLSTVTDSSGIITYTYDALGRNTFIDYSNGMQTTYTYDSRNRITNIAHTNSSAEVLQSFAYTLNAKGFRTKILEHSGREVAYTYNAVDQLTKETISNDPNGVNTTTSFTYDTVGNLLTKSIDVLETTYSYNANDQLTQKGSTTLTYDDNGNLIAQDDTTYAYDDKNRLTKVQTPTDTVEYSYDANNNRVAKVINGDTTTYLIDTNTPYAQVITETKEDGTTIDYTYGTDLLTQTTDAQSLFYLADALGSVKALANQSEDVTDHYTYSLYGELLEHVGTSDNSFLFTGEQFDKVIDSYYLRARYYAPDNARFLSRDTYDGTDNSPASQNHYLYTHSNPINYTDPSGHILLASIATSTSLRTTVFSSRTMALGSARSGFMKTFGCDLMGFVATESINAGIYLYMAEGFGKDAKPYVGKTKRSFRQRLKEHLDRSPWKKATAKKLKSMSHVLERFNFKIKDDLLLETIEQVILDALGGPEKTANTKNPMGGRRPKMPDNIDKIKKLICKGK